MTTVTLGSSSLRLLVLILLLAILVVSANDASESDGFEEAPDNKFVEGRYLVVLKDVDLLNNTIDVDAVKDRLLQSSSFSSDFRFLKAFRNAIKAFSLEVSDDGEDLEGLQTARERAKFKLLSFLNDQDVAYVEEVQLFEASETPSTIQTCATWGLDRIDQVAPSLDGNYQYTLTGEGVTAYILDTGIRSSHDEYRGRVECGFNAFENEGLLGKEDCEDHNGHGTHVAGTVGGNTYGVAKNVDLVTVKVLNGDGTGSTDGIVEGIDWMVQQANERGGSHVANLSLGGGLSLALNLACRVAVNQGIFMAVAAGNEKSSACFVSPVSSVISMTVGATDPNDVPASFSNFGRCVDIFAPGTNIRSASHCGDDEVADLSGTSMAAPHVAGVAALYFEQQPSASASEIKEFMLEDAIAGAIRLPSDSASPNLLLSTVALLEGTEPPASADTSSCPKVKMGTCDDRLARWKIALIVVAAAVASCAVCSFLVAAVQKRLRTKGGSDDMSEDGKELGNNSPEDGMVGDDDANRNVDK